MALHIIVTAKQVIDPEMPISAYQSLMLPGHGW